MAGNICALRRLSKLKSMFYFITLGLKVLLRLLFP